MTGKSKTEKSRSNGLVRVLKVAAIAVGAFVLSDAAMSWMTSGRDTSSASSVGWLEVVPAILISVFLVLFLHEIGHVILGRLAGSRLTIFIVGPLRLQATSNGLKPYLNRSIALAGGLAGTAPTDSTNLRRKMTLMTAGGPAMSLLVAGLAYTASIAMPDGFFGVLLFAVALMSAVIFAVTIIPMRNGGFMTDGARLFMLYRNGPEARRWCALAALGGASTFGERPREWDESLIETSLSPADGTLDDAGASLNAAYRALDLGDTRQAKSLLQRAANTTDVPESLRSQALLEQAFFNAFFEDNADESRRLLSGVKSGSVLEKHVLLRAESAVLMAEGKTGEARYEARQALKTLGDSMSPGTARLEREWLEELEEGGYPASSSQVGA